jgi:hypothetical protein
MKERVGGRPQKFKNPEDLARAINGYIDATPQEEITLTGLCLVIGSKQLLNDYEKRKGFDEIVIRAKLIIENAYEISLRQNGNAGDIFGLKNFGWRDKTEVEHGLSENLIEKFGSLPTPDLLKKLNELTAGK